MGKQKDSIFYGDVEEVLFNKEAVRQESEWNERTGYIDI